MARRTYEDQYWEEPRRSIIGWLFWFVFKAPGKAILWWEYMFPKRGQVYASGRRYGNPIVEVITSIGFWLAIAYAALLLTHPYHGNSTQLATSSYQRRPIPNFEPKATDPPTPQVSPSPVEDQNTRASQPAPDTGEPRGIPPEQVVTVSYPANVRATPAGNVVDRVDPGQEIAIVTTQGPWAQVRRGDSVIGWVHRSLLTPAR